MNFVTKECFVKLKRLKPCDLPSSSSSRHSRLQNGGTKSPKTIRNTVSKKEYKCTICSKPYRSYQGLAHHKRSHTNERPYGCKLCQKFFKRKEILNVHNQYKHSIKSHFCPQCPASFALSSGLRSHISVVHEKDQRTKRKCNICHKILAKSHIAAHLKWHAKIMPFACVMCDKPFYALNNLKLHIQSKHLQERPYSCSKCPATFPVKYYLTQHVLRVHKPAEWYTVKCVICDKTFHTEYALNQHMTSHTGEKHYKCATCGKRYMSNAVLRFHNETVHGTGRQLKHFCIFCDKGFSKRSGLNEHISAHTREKPFSCNLCSFSCSKKGSLKSHLRVSKIHNKGLVKPLTKFCIMCNKGFANNVGLNRHLFVHTRERPFWCEQCRSSYISRCYLKIHIWKIHGLK